MEDLSINLPVLYIICDCLRGQYSRVPNKRGKGHLLISRKAPPPHHTHTHTHTPPPPSTPPNPPPTHPSITTDLLGTHTDILTHPDKYTYTHG